MGTILEWIRHLDVHINEMIAYFGYGSYAILFGVIFAETGLVVTPFLPGDSLLFILGSLAAQPESILRLDLLLVILTIAAIVGDSVNYWIGAQLGPRIFRGEKVRFLNRKHLEKAQAFYEKYGAKTIVLARFVPIVRTFAPFVAGMGSMNYSKFMLYNCLGGILWVVVCTLAGYWFSEIPWVKEHFELVVVGVVFISILPIAWELFAHWRQSRRAVQPESSPEST